jgi:iron complex outermembrane receptor protein
MLLATLTSGQHSLIGNLIDVKQEPVVGVRVCILDNVDEQLCSITDDKGEFLFEGLEEGDYQLFVNSAFFSAEKMVSIPFDGSLTITVQRTVKADEVIVRATRVSPTAPVSHSNLDQEELERLNMGQDVPYILQWTPSMVVTSDAGTGIGYTYLRIRGSDQTRINVTINGIPLNDAESQQVFWVDLPDFMGSTDQVQIQRGLGSSTNGPGAFGATVNLNTNKVETDPGGSVQLGAGSYGTWRARLEGHSGLMGDGFFVAGRLSRIHSDGFIDRARADLYSGFFTTGRVGKRSMLKFNVMLGQEETYQAWYGVPVQYIDDPDLRTYNIAGTSKPGEPHEDEVDFYQQSHYQAFYTLSLSNDWLLNIGANYTRGKGYFELYQADTEDYIQRLWLDNHFYGLAPSLQWITTDASSSLIIGGGAFQYRGRHFGEALDLDGDLVDLVYDNDAVKTDMNLYSKYEQVFHSSWRGWLDLQYRYVGYKFQGLNRQGLPTDQELDFHFFNPKMGFSYAPTRSWNAYGYLGVGHREPNRDDLTESSPNSRPGSERMINAELGWRLENPSLKFRFNTYGMWYKDQLVQTGELNDVGAATRINVPDSYRLGLEAEVVWMFSDKWLVNGAVNLSRNRIRVITNYFDDWDSGGQLPLTRENVPISYSPEAIGHTSIRYAVLGSLKNTSEMSLSLELRTKVVGPQYLDNSGDEVARLKGYNYSDFQVNGQWPLNNGQVLGVKLLVANVFNQSLVTNGWIYRFNSDAYDPVPDDPYAFSEGNGNYQLKGLFPQAGINVQAGVSWSF